MKRGLVEEPWRGVRQQVCAARRSKAKVHSRLHRPIVCPGKFDGTTPSRGNPLLCSFVHLFGFYSKDCSDWSEDATHGIDGLVRNVSDGLAIQVFPLCEQPVIACVVERAHPCNAQLVGDICADNADLLSPFDKVHYQRLELPGKSGKRLSFQGGG